MKEIPPRKAAGFFSVSKKSERYGVIPNQSADWCGNPPVERKSYWFRIENI